MDIKEAIIELKKGNLVYREGWGDTLDSEGVDTIIGIFMQVPTEISVYNIVPNMQSLPKGVKDYLLDEYEDETDNKMSAIEEGEDYNYKDYVETIKYQNQIVSLTQSNCISSFSFTSADVLAEDWRIY